MFDGEKIKPAAPDQIEDDVLILGLAANTGFEFA